MLCSSQDPLTYECGDAIKKRSELLGFVFFIFTPFKKLSVLMSRLCDYAEHPLNCYKYRGGSILSHIIYFFLNVNGFVMNYNCI